MSCQINIKRNWRIPLALTLAGAAACSRQTDSALTVSAAASLQDALEQIAPAFGQSHPHLKVRFNFGGSGTLEQQIERGAPVDVFLSAAPKPMDQLTAKGLILSGTRRDLLRNQIVLIAPRDSTSLHSFADLAMPSVKLIALGDPGSVPAGDYGRQVLQALHLWQTVQGKLVLAKDVRQVLTYVETGNADAGVVYATDARLSSGVRVVATAPESSHAPVVYPTAVVEGSREPSAARAFVSFLEGPQAREIFTRFGFTPVSP